MAAAFCYATSQPVSGKVLVYDLGGGTFDVTIMEVHGMNMDIICSQGDHQLGGIDFDNKIIEILQQQYKEKFNAELISSDTERAKHEDEAEDIKKTLSRRTAVKTMLYGPAGSMRVELTQEQFEKATTSLVARTDMLVEVGAGRSAPETVGHRQGSARRRQHADAAGPQAPRTDLRQAAGELGERR